MASSSLPPKGDLKVVVVVALALSWTVRDRPSLEAPFHIAWPVLIPFVYLAEVTVVHLHFRRDTRRPMT